jgi:hypothetical protein
VAPHFVERRPCVLQDMELVVDDIGLRQHLVDRVEVGSMHVRTDGLDCRTLPRVEARLQQARQALLRALRGQADHLAVHQIGEHGVELLRLPAVDLIRSQMFGPPFRPRAIPFAQKGLLRASGLAPTDPVAYGGMRRGID